MPISEYETVWRVTAVLQGIPKEELDKRFKEIVAQKREELCSKCYRGEKLVIKELSK